MLLHPSVVPRVLAQLQEKGTGRWGGEEGDLSPTLFLIFTYRGRRSPHSSSPLQPSFKVYCYALLCLRMISTGPLSLPLAGRHIGLCCLAVSCSQRMMMTRPEVPHSPTW